jgi:hypothetical protein
MFQASLCTNDLKPCTLTLNLTLKLRCAWFQVSADLEIVSRRRTISWKQSAWCNKDIQLSDFVKVQNSERKLLNPLRLDTHKR